MNINIISMLCLTSAAVKPKTDWSNGFRGNTETILIKILFIMDIGWLIDSSLYVLFTVHR